MKEYQTENFRRKKELELNDENEYLSDKSNKEDQDNNGVNNSLEVNVNSNKNLNKEEILASPKIEKLENNENDKIEEKKVTCRFSSTVRAGRTARARLRS